MKAQRGTGVLASITYCDGLYLISRDKKNPDFKSEITL
jgi:hypothetical protein